MNSVDQSQLRFSNFKKLIQISIFEKRRLFVLVLGIIGVPGFLSFKRSRLHKYFALGCPSLKQKFLLIYSNVLTK